MLEGLIFKEMVHLGKILKDVFLKRQFPGIMKEFVLSFSFFGMCLADLTKVIVDAEREPAEVGVVEFFDRLFAEWLLDVDKVGLQDLNF